MHHGAHCADEPEHEGQERPRVVCPTEPLVERHLDDDGPPTIRNAALRTIPADASRLTAVKAIAYKNPVMATTMAQSPATRSNDADVMTPSRG